MTRLFVYGTLRRGLGNPFARLLSDGGSYVGQARMQAKLYRVADYPGLVLSGDPADEVIGDVYELGDADRILPALDEYEGCGPADPPPREFQRVLGSAILDTGAPVQAWVYVYRRPVDEDRRIASGDFLRKE